MADEIYNKKLESLQQYIPFLDNMIAQLKDPSKKNREQQLSKMQSLHAMITDKRKKLKLDTLIKCEDVISKLYEKVHNKPIVSKKSCEDLSTPASPSPPREILTPQPLTIPTERLEEKRIPKIDIYSSAGESLNRARMYQNIGIGAKFPDMSKPPISLEDLKTLEEDVQEKINESCLNTASLQELNTLREKLTEQIQMEDVLMKSPQKQKKDELEAINTTVRNSLTLTKKVIQPPDKVKVKDSSKVSPNKPAEQIQLEDVFMKSPQKTSSSSSTTASPKKEQKNSVPSTSKSPKILKEPPSIFGNILSHIDDQILEGKKKKEERRSSVTGKDERKPDKDSKKRDRKHSSSKDDTSDEKRDSKNAKKKERSSSSTEEKSKAKDEKRSKGSKESDSKKKERHHSGDKEKSKDEKKDSDSKEGKKDEDKHKHVNSEKTKTASFSLTGKTSFEEEEDRLKKELEEKNKETNIAKGKTESDNIVGTISVKKELAVLKTKADGANNKEEESKQTSFKRLADKYHPKPKKTTTESDVDKEISDIIEEKMKTSPPKIPLINEIPAPIPPPTSLLVCSQIEPEKPEPAPQLPAVLQNILAPGTTELINTVVNQLRQNNSETENRNMQLAHTSSTDNFVSEYVKEDNFVSEYIREDFIRDEFSPNNRVVPDFNHFTPQPQPMRMERLNFEPPSVIQNNQFNQMNQPNLRFMSPLGEGFNEGFTPNRPFTPMPQAFPQPFSNFQPNQNIQKASSDMQPLDYYPPNAPIPANQYNCGPPLLSPEVPHFHNEQKPVGFGMMPNHDTFVHDDMRWRQEDTRFSWDRRDQDLRMNRDPRTYREYREMRESRDPRVTNRDPRDVRDSRTIRDPRVNRDLRENRDRDPRVNKERDFDRDRTSFRDSRSQSRDTRPSRFDSKFDRMYSRTNRDRSRSRSRSYSKETFTSPLDSLYTGKEEHKTGKGYGVQNFRIPKVKKEDDKEQSTKVSSTNEEVDDVVQSVNDDSNDSTNNEVTGSNIDTEEVENTEQSEEVAKEHEVNEQEKDDNEKEEGGKKIETEVISEEPPKLQNEAEETKTVVLEVYKPSTVTQPLEQDQAKPADQTILAQFFANLLSSQNKKEKKTALYSLISTFSDSFSEKELTKITKIIKADDEVDSSEEEEDEAKKPDEKPKAETSVEQEREAHEEGSLDESPMKVIKRKCRRRVRRISSTASLKDEKNQEGEVVKTPEPSEVPKSEEGNVVVSVGERIKSRKRASITPPKPKKKCKTELDMLHEDIQDMFIRDGVLTASGKRMCRLLKNDPNALTTPQTTPAEPQKVRKKPGPKPKPKPNSSEMKTMKNIRVLLPKIPDSNLEQKEEAPRRSLRSTNKAVYAESDEEDSSTIAEDDSVLGDGSVRGDDSEAESTDTDKDKMSQASDNFNKTKTRRRRGKSWASGNIPTNKKKKKKQLSLDESTDGADTKDSETIQPDVDKSFVEPDKNYYIDFTTHKAHQCRLCDYKGRFITTHYKTQHPESEVLTSRFSPALALEAIKDSEKNLAKYEELLRVNGGRFHFTCRLCAFNTKVPPTIFYDHVTTHTGEYRHICPLCDDFSASSGKTLKSHMSNIHNNVDKRVARKSYSQTIIFAYMCGECNYVQLTEKNVEDHINIFHLQKPKIYKVNMSTTLDADVVNIAEKEAKKDSTAPTVTAEDANVHEEPRVVSKDKSKMDIEDKPMPPPKPKYRAKPAPKCVKDRLKAKAAMSDKDECPSDSSSVSSIAESESSTNTDQEKGTPDRNPVKKTGTVSKRRLTRDLLMTSDEELIISGRSRRAAKDKAAEKLKTLMEFTEGGTRKKSISSSGEEEMIKKEEPEKNNDNDQVEEPKPSPEKKVRNDQVEEPKPSLEKKVEKTKIKKEIDLNVFTCKTDIQEENKKIEQERLLLMEELNKSVGSRTSLNFVDKLCNRLSNNDIMVKQEPKDDFNDNLFPSTSQDPPPEAMPVLEKSLSIHSSESASAKSSMASTPPPKKPILETEDMQVNANFDVTQKNDKLIMDMIQKLKGKLAYIPDDKCDSPAMTEETDYDSEGPPPLRRVKELPNVKPADESAKFLLIGGSVKVIKYPNHLMFCCLVPPCVFSTENRDVFQKHCSEAHKHLDSSTLCEMCGMEIMSTAECTLLENIFRHAIEQHADFMNEEVKLEEKAKDVKPPSTLLRIRKLSGDALSISKDSEESDATSVSQESIEESNKENQIVTSVSQVTVSEIGTAESPPETMAELELSDDNPFPFKIAGVMSLAEPLPPLAPIAKTSPQVPSASQLVVKEAKLTAAELGRQRKTAKAMAKFVASVSDLYKCPHYYCLFSTNFRDFLERHLRAHKLDRESMIPCVYCDMKTPWEHVPMHIDIRHAHCRFACSYCLYRGVVKEYVFLHQDQVHPENDYSVIALPQPKHSKKWTITDLKVDPKNLCEPYRCTAACGVEFLFENEFRRHLQDVHQSNVISCGYKNCLFKFQANKMHIHWARIHGVCTYQCGYCKMNSNDVRNLYKHLALCHQGCQPDILIRKCVPVATQEGSYLGYGPEAFAVLRKINTIPNISADNKSDVPLPDPPSVPLVAPTTAVSYAVPAKAMLQVVTSKSMLNRTVTLVSTNTATSSGNIVFLPTVTNTLSGIAMSPQTGKVITSVAPISETSKVVPALQEVTVSPVQEDGGAAKGSEKEARENDVTIEPVEHITVGEDNNQSSEENDTCEADPLSLEADADMNEASKSAAESSGDESDGNKQDKSKKEAKIGLLGYQLYRCAFCDISFSNAVDFKRHATYSLTCRMEAQVVKPFVCVHCEKQLKSPHVLVEHIQCHGVLRFTCSLCGCKFPTIAQTRNHIKNRHNITHTSLTPLNAAKQNIDVDEYLVRPKLMLQMGAAKDPAPAEQSSTSAVENVYTPETVEQIPMRHILSSSIKCGLCSYSTKVRTNMVRHLQFHSEEKAVPDTAPVNPVPCLEKNEKMFDKMINLASSSHTNTRMGGAKTDPKEKEAESYPEFIPSHCRYVCCAHGCSYMCPEEGNLRHHLIALHDGETNFTCVHCKTDLTPTDADSLIKHFKLHGLQLYKCHYCPFIHNLKHKVEKHVADNHLDAPSKVITVRFMESEPKDAAQEPQVAGAQGAAATSSGTATTTKLYKPWRCCMCKYKSQTQTGIQNHVFEKHEIDSQFKCALCSYKTNDKDTFADHFKTAHENQAIDIIYAYRKLEEGKEKEPETFDTTPLWQRDRPRVRHIRGILFDESTPTPAKSPKKVKSATVAPSAGPSGVKTPAPATAVKSAVSSAPGPSGVKPTTSYSGVPSNDNIDLSIESVVNGTADILKDSISDEFFHAVNKLIKESTEDIAKVKESMVIVIEDEDEPKTPPAKEKDNKNAPVAKNRPTKRKAPEIPGVSKIPKMTSEDVIDLESSGSGSDSEHDELSERNLKLKFGGFGAPLWKQFKCPVCNMFKSKRISDFVFHLFKEMKVFRFQCKMCMEESITYRYMYKHVRDHHRFEKCKESIVALPPNEQLLIWLQMVIREQSVAISKIYHSKSPQSAAVPSPSESSIKCDFCPQTFPSDQERNEHSVTHWIALPYSCTACSYGFYTNKDAQKHVASVHQDQNASVMTIGPTVEKLLELCDGQHEKEAEATLVSRAVAADSAALLLVTPDAGEDRDPLGDVPAPTSDPVENVPDNTATLIDSDLVIVTKTDTDVPSESDVFCCDICPFMANSEVQVLAHVSDAHDHVVGFKKLNRTACEAPAERVGCTLCSEVGSEVRIRQHHVERHQGEQLNIYRFECAICPLRRRFLKFAGLKLHFNRLHRGSAVRYVSVCGDECKDVGRTDDMMTYRCSLCPYARELRPNGLSKLRQHLKMHFKAFMCGICRSVKYKARSGVLSHYAKEHPDVLQCDQQVVHDTQLLEDLNATLAGIVASATYVSAESSVKNTARKSTSAPHASSAVHEYSFYGSRPEEVDLSRIMTSVEVNGMHLNMSAEKLSKIFDLNVVVAVEDCNLSVNLSNVFDS